MHFSSTNISTRVLNIIKLELHKSFKSIYEASNSSSTQKLFNLSFTYNSTWVPQICISTWILQIYQLKFHKYINTIFQNVLTVVPLGNHSTWVLRNHSTLDPQIIKLKIHKPYNSSTKNNYFRVPQKIIVSSTNISTRVPKII